MQKYMNTPLNNIYHIGNGENNLSNQIIQINYKNITKYAFSIYTYCNETSIIII